MNPESAAFAQILAKLQRPAPPAATPVARLFSNDPREHCLACRVFAAVGAQCRHCRGPYCSESCKKQDCQVHVCEFYYKIEASLTGVTNPAISRTFIIRHTATFEELHEALQIAFCWRPTTNYEFCMNKRLIGSADRIATLTMRAEEKARFDEFKDGSTTYIVEAMKNAYADRRILGYSCHASCTLVHCLRIRPAFYVRLTNSVLPDVRCILGTGHPYAEGFDLDEWRELKDAYKKDWPTS
ncbi:hypothetical protein N431DRAFT_147438 [Stipitochalara longipes BDJ]|nr:hypothetical protein N431DRAFT_147438 [Stipitochalara longipes BDJ]